MTASGLSAGGYMAVQLHVAHSATVKGVGVIAGGPYYCAQGSVWTAYYNCRTPGWWSPFPDVRRLRSETDRLAKAGRIDPTSNLVGARVWLFSGTRDRTVAAEVVEQVKVYYSLYGVKAAFVNDKPAGHAMVTLDAGNEDCSVTRDPYINDCDYDAAGELLGHLLGSLRAPASKPGGGLMAFDGGQVYVPAACSNERCRVHVAFHGCRQSAERFARDAGYNRWADTNRLIVLYPQVEASWNPFAFNPRGCWDWWGYSGANYHTREGVQIREVMAMLKRLAAGD